MATEIFTGKDALKAVADPKGQWNWALVGADPEALPLAGGGSGSIDEMRECLWHQEKSAVLFGLLRLSFGTGRVRVHRNVFIMASGVDEAFAQGVKESMVSRGRAMNKRPAMEKALDAIAHTHAKIIVSHKDDLSVEAIVSNLQKTTTADADLVTVENFHLALVDFQATLKPAATPAAAVEEKEVARDDDDDDRDPALAIRKQSSAVVAAPPPEVLKEQPQLDGDEELLDVSDRTPTVQPAEETEDPSKASAAQGAAIGAPEPIDSGAKPTFTAPELTPVEPPAPFTPMERKEGGSTAFIKGDLVEVYSASSSKWHDDGVVLHVLEFAEVQDGLSLPAGSVKIQYQNDHRLKWVPPCHLSRCLRKSERPRPPKALTGELLKETHNWVAEWHVRYFQLKRGWFQWWLNREDAVEGVKPNGALDLTGLAVGSAGTVFSLRTANSKGVVYNFDARNIDDVATWMQGLKEHAAYIDRMKSLMASRNQADYA